MKHSRMAAVAALALASGLTLAACSSSTDEAAPEPAASEAAEVAEEATDEAAAEEMAEDAGMADEAPASAGTIVDIAASTDGFGTLVAAVQAADLVETLSGPGPFTVFAPTDDAFAALPEGLVDALLLPENKDVLVKILTYHAVPGAVMAADVTDGEVATVEGQNVTFSTADGVKINDANIIQTDIVADNGVIHVIDAVIVPPDVDPAALLAQ